jgi:hypothetical protein
VTIDDLSERSSLLIAMQVSGRQDGRLHGILTLARLREGTEENWTKMLIRDVMEPVSDNCSFLLASVAHALGSSSSTMATLPSLTLKDLLWVI